MMYRYLQDTILNMVDPKSITVDCELECRVLRCSK